MAEWLGVTVALVVVAVALLLLYSRWCHQYWRKRGVYTSSPLPLLGHLLPNLNVGGPRWEYVDKIYTEKKEEKFFGTYMLLSPNLTVTDVELSQRVLIKDFDHFVDRRHVDLEGTGSDMLKDMLTNATGNHWKGIRSTLSPTFTSGKMKNMFYLVQAKSQDLVEHCRRERDSKSMLEMRNTLGKYTMDVIATCAFGMEINALKGENNEFLDAAANLFKPSVSLIFRSILLSVCPWLFKKMKLSLGNKSQSFFVNTVKKTIEERKRSSRRGDFMDLMLDARETLEEEETRGKLNSYKFGEDTIIAQSVLFILGGFDTTANTLSFVAYLLAKHKDWQETLRKELKERLRTAEDGKLSYNDIMEAKYLEAILAETLRLYAPAHVTQRQCTQDYTFPGTSLSIEKGMVVDIPIYSFHHDPEFFPEPKIFKPERFLPENKQSVPSGAYLPFGLGPRMCIATRFAQMEAKLAIADLVLNFDLSLGEGYEQLQLSKTPGIIRPKEDSLRIVVKDLETVQEMTG